MNKISKYLKYRLRNLGLNRLFKTEYESSMIAYFDTSVSSLNIGDEIINIYGRKIVEDIFPNDQIFIANTHNGISGKIINIINICKYRLVCGTNLLDSNISKRLGCWNITWLDIFRMKHIILLGVGWSEYSPRPNYLNKLFYKLLLSNKSVHSVRDEYTRNMLLSIGFDNVINTGCPTLWGITEDICNQIPVQKSDCVIFTLTDYDKDVKADQEIINILLRNYKRIYFWPQGSGDLLYMESLMHENVKILAPRLSAYQNILAKHDIDYVGTRLHAGIFAIRNLKRTIVISIDNRAKEISKSNNLTILERQNVKDELHQMIQSEFKTNISIDRKAIESWASQFN